MENNDVNHSQVATIIVNYNTGAMVCRALDSLAKERTYLVNLSVVVVDNQSPNDSFSQIKQHIEKQSYGAWAKIILAEKNGGYAYGNNLGFSYYKNKYKDKPSPIEYYWLLNPDTYLRPKACLNLVNFLSTTDGAICGSRLEDPDGTPQISTFNFPNTISEILSGFSLGVLDKLFARYRVTRALTDTRETVDWVAGASLMIHQSVFKRVGLMDDKYFLYFEEVDYCLQVQRAGFKCWYVPESRIVHEVGAATGISDVRKRQPRRPTYWFDSRRRYFLKNHGFITLILADFGWTIGYIFWCLRKRLTSPKDLDNQPPKYLQDFVRNSIFNVARLKK